MKNNIERINTYKNGKIKISVNFINEEIYTLIKEAFNVFCDDLYIEMPGTIPYLEVKQRGDIYDYEFYRVWEDGEDIIKRRYISGGTITSSLNVSDKNKEHLKREEIGKEIGVVITKHLCEENINSIIILGTLLNQIADFMTYTDADSQIKHLQQLKDFAEEMLRHKVFLGKKEG